MDAGVDPCKSSRMLSADYKYLVSLDRNRCSPHNTRLMFPSSVSGTPPKCAYTLGSAYARAGFFLLLPTFAFFRTGSSASGL